MISLNQIKLMAQYNQWMNKSLYLASAKLPIEKLKENKKAFFGSVIGTLNHIIVADIIWLKRFSTHPANHIELEPLRQTEQPKSLDQNLYTDFGELFQERTKLDNIIINWCNELSESDLSYYLRYNDMKGIPAVKEFGSLIFHFFNHQTHHRGQVTTLLFQEGIDVGVTDLLTLIPNYIDK
ncbi:MAG: DinB family protein [Scytonematopsis contorta HA4267-MV1]|jgi:uncharacterized damage-inducible protein DinB|nr:DinB family protein [Scytonematopsis contorta HA4267-MV1]